MAKVQFEEIIGCSLVAHTHTQLKCSQQLSPLHGSAIPLPLIYLYTVAAGSAEAKPDFLNPKP